MQTLKFIGNSSAFSDGVNNSAYYKKDDYLLLLDCGEDVFKTIKNSTLLSGINTVDIWISHLHGDHAGSLSSFIFYLYYIYKIKPNVIYSKGFTNLDTYLDITGCYGCCNLLYNTCSNEEIKIKTEKTKHCNDMQSYSIEMTIEGKVIYYTADCSELNHQTLLDFNNGLIDELYVDCCLANYDGNVHLNIDKLYNCINKEYANRVYCMHLDNRSELLVKTDKYNFNITENEILTRAFNR